MHYSGLRISGSNNFCDVFHFDAVRPTMNKAIVFKIDSKIFKKLSIATKRYAIVLGILKKSDGLWWKRDFPTIENDKFYIA